MPSGFTRYKLLRAASVAMLAALCAAGPASAEGGSGTGGASFAPPPPPPAEATIRNGRAIAPHGAPSRVRRVIAAANRLVRKPYRYGGGHRTRISKVDKGYDCSGSVSYALYGGRFLRRPLASGGLMKWGRRGAGRWITAYSNRRHAFVVVAGLRFDTGMRDRNAGGPSTGPRWSKRMRRVRRFVARHPRGY